MKGIKNEKKRLIEKSENLTEEEEKEGKEG